MSSLSVVIGYFGDKRVWDPLVQRAVESVHSQTTTVGLIVQYAGELHTARNEGALKANGEYVCFLDADDELSSGYADSILECAAKTKADVIQPSTLGVYEDGSEDEFPVLIPPRESLLVANHLIIGSPIRRELFGTVGGFSNYPICEDWELFLKCWVHGASFAVAPEAVYRVHVRPGSRNQDTAGFFARTYSEIRSRYTIEARAKGLIP